MTEHHRPLPKVIVVFLAIALIAFLGMAYLDSKAGDRVGADNYAVTYKEFRTAHFLKIAGGALLGLGAPLVFLFARRPRLRLSDEAIELRDWTSSSRMAFADITNVTRTPTRQYVFHSKTGMLTVEGALADAAGAAFQQAVDRAEQART